MTLENEICDSLEDLSYPKMDVIVSDVSLLTDLQTFSSIVSWISSQLQRIDDSFESLINPIKDDSELTSFKIELNSCLRELNSPLIDCSLSSDTNRLSILNSLCGELLASRMNRVNGKSGSNRSMAISMSESETARELKTILISLGMGKPPNNISPKILFNKIKDKLSQRWAQEFGQDFDFIIEDSFLLPNGLTLSPEQWNALKTLNDQHFKDYAQRRELMLRRCDCTVKSFTWKTDESQSVAENEINDMYGKERLLLDNKPNVSFADALAARESDFDEVLSGVVSNSRANCLINAPEAKGRANKGKQQLVQLHKYIIDSVPDRGGRTHEQQAPQKESFTQQQHKRDNPQRGRGRGGGGRGGVQGGGGGAKYQEQNQQRIQGSGWAQNSGNRYSNNPAFDNQMLSRGGYRDQQNYNNYQSDQRYSGRDDYPHNSGYQQQQQWNANYQQQYTPQIAQQYDRQSYNYSDQSYYGNSYRQQYQPTDSNHYNEQRDRNYNRDRGGYRRGGGRR